MADTTGGAASARLTAAAAELRPGTWNELCDALFEGSWRPKLRRHRSNHAYRGMPDSAFDLRTSLMRLGPSAGAAAYLPAALRALLRDEGASVITAEMLAGAAETLDALDALDCEPFLVFFEPPSLDERIINQFALFALMSGSGARMDEWLSARPQLARRVVVPAALKPEVRDRLDQVNVTERVLFPGMDGLSQWPARYYRPRGSPSR